MSKNAIVIFPHFQLHHSSSSKQYKHCRSNNKTETNRLEYENRNETTKPQPRDFYKSPKQQQKLSTTIIKNLHQYQ